MPLIMYHTLIVSCSLLSHINNACLMSAKFILMMRPWAYCMHPLTRGIYSQQPLALKNRFHVILISLSRKWHHHSNHTHSQQLHVTTKPLAKQNNTYNYNSTTLIKQYFTSMLSRQVWVKIYYTRMKYHFNVYGTCNEWHIALLINPETLLQWFWRWKTNNPHW